jgi:signal transduction histidine kinase
VKQVLLNLLSNALKFTPEGGRIDVRASLCDGSALIAVRDTGVGIAPESARSAPPLGTWRAPGSGSPSRES